RCKWRPAEFLTDWRNSSRRGVCRETYLEKPQHRRPGPDPRASKGEREPRRSPYIQTRHRGSFGRTKDKLLWIRSRDPRRRECSGESLSPRVLPRARGPRENLRVWGHG